MSYTFTTVKWFDDKKGWGFLADARGDAFDVFFHYTDIQVEGYRTLKDGEEVRCRVWDDPMKTCPYEDRYGARCHKTRLHAHDVTRRADIDGEWREQ